MTTLYLVRHGEYDNPGYMYPGRSPGYPLSSRGREQVELLAPYFRDKHVGAIYSSPLLRTRETAEILSSALHLPVQFDDRLLEVLTHAEGASMNLFDATNGELSYTPKYLSRGAESMGELAERMAGFIEEKRREYLGKEVLVVTHGDPMRFVTMKYLGLPIDFPTSRTVAIPLAGGYKFVFDDTKNSCEVSSITKSG